MDQQPRRFKEYYTWWENFMENLFEAPFRSAPQEAALKQGEKKKEEHETA